MMASSIIDNLFYLFSCLRTPSAAIVSSAAPAGLTNAREMNKQVREGRLGGSWIQRGNIAEGICV